MIGSITNAGRIATTCTVLSLLACYGTLASVAALAAIGVVLSVNSTAWAVTITGFSAMAVIALGIQAIKQKTAGPLLLGLAALAAIGYSMFWDYSLAIELFGFCLLGAGVIWDQRQSGARNSHPNQANTTPINLRKLDFDGFFTRTRPKDDSPLTTVGALKGQKTNIPAQGGGMNEL